MDSIRSPRPSSNSCHIIMLNRITYCWCIDDSATLGSLMINLSQEDCSATTPEGDS